MPEPIEYEMAEINTRDIIVDDAGQRDVNARKAQFNKIMREFDPRLVQPLSVALIDGKYYCFNGQMTMKVLKAKNGNRDLRVTCRVYRDLTKMDAADLFAKQCGTVSPVKLGDKIRVKANYGDQEAMDFIRIAEMNGLEISFTGSQGIGKVAAISAMWSEYKAFSDNRQYASFVNILCQAWNGAPESLQANILRGVGLFMRTYKGQYKKETLITHLRKQNPNDLVRNAQADRTSGARKYAVQVLLAYNYKMREEYRLPNIL